MQRHLPAGAGVTFHPDLLAALLSSAAMPSAPAFIEFIAEALPTKQHWRQARALAEVAPIAIHGTGLSLGSVDGVDDARVARLCEVVSATGAGVVSEHLAFVRAGGTEIGHLTPLPLSRAAVDVVSRNVDRVRRRLPSLLLENAWSPLPPSRLPDEMDEPEFLHAIVARTGCGLLLDVANLVANAQNRGVDVNTFIDRLPLFAVREIHVAGSATEEDGFVVDTHADPVTDVVFAALAAVLARTGPLPVCLERDHHIDVDAVFAELARVRALVGACGAGGVFVEGSHEEFGVVGASAEAVAALGQWQRSLAVALTNDDDSDGDLRCARAILARKRRERAHARPPQHRLVDDVTRLAQRFSQRLSRSLR